MDSFTVILTDSNRDITEDLHYDPTYTDSYPIINDNFTTDARSNDLKVQFVGRIDGIVVIDESYVIGSDCCHIKLVSGNTEITV